MQRYSGKLLAALTAIVMIVGSFHPTVVRAAAGEGTATIAVGTGDTTNASTATYGSNLSTVGVTVGTLAYLKIRLTVGASNIAATQNNVTIQIPTNLFPTNGFDTNEEAALTDVNASGEYFISYSDTTPGVTDNSDTSFAASASVNTGLVTIQANEQMDATDVLILTVAVNDMNNFIAAQNVTISVDDTGANSLVAIGVLPTVSTAAADAAASIVVASPTVGAAGALTITMAVPFPLDAADAFRITFPAYINISGVTADQVATGTLDDAGGTITCNDSSQILTCVTSGATQTSGTVILANITSYYSGSTDITMFEVENEANTTNDIATDSSVALTNIVEYDATASAVIATPVVGGVGTVTVTLTTPFALDADDTIVITFPDFIRLSGLASAVTGTFEATDTITCAAVSQTVTCTTTGATNATGTIIMTGITPGYIGTDDINTGFVVYDEGVVNTIASDILVALTDVTAADAAASVTLGTNNYVGAVGTTTLDVTLPFALDADDTIEFTFPSSMNVSAVASAVTGTLEASNSITCAAVSQLVTCTTSAATNASGTIIMTGIKAAFAATTDMTSLEVENEGSALQDIATDSVIAMTNTLSSDSESEDDSSTSSEETYDIEVTVPEASAAYMPGDDVEITWSTAGGTASAGFVSLYYSVDGGTTLETIALNTVNDSTYNWTVPDITEQSVIIYAESTDLLGVLATDESGAFSINGDAAPEDDAEDVDTSEDSEELLPDGSYMVGESWSTVYYVHDGMRHPFLDSQTFFTYADDFDDVIEVEDGYLANYTIGTPMLPQAGTVLVKIQSVNSVYVLEADNTLRWITSEDLAEELYGNDWADYVIDVPVTAWGHFTIGDDVDNASDVEVDLDSMQTRDELNSK